MIEPLPIRTATAADRPALLALCTAAFDEDEAVGMQMVLDDPRFGESAFWVAEDGDDVVACLGLLTVDLYVGEVQIPTGQPEYIATADAYRNRGLVRRLMALAHETSDARGDLFQLIGGIPYFYRRFGYGWALPLSRSWRLRSNDVAADDGATVRPLTEADVPAASALHQARASAADVHNARSHTEWLAMVRRVDDPPTRYVVERDGDVVGSATIHVLGSGATRVSDVAVRQQRDIAAIVARAVALGAGDVNLIGRRGGALEAWCLGYGVDFSDEVWAMYGRIPDPVALIERLRPVLDARLADSHFRSWSGVVPFTTYVSGFELEVTDGTVTRVATRAPDIDPGSDVVGVAPDILPGLVFGRRGARAEEDLHPDVQLGHHAGIVDALFPRQTSDITLWF